MYRSGIGLPVGKFPDIGNQGLSPHSVPPSSHISAVIGTGSTWLAHPGGRSTRQAQAHLHSTLSTIKWALLCQAVGIPAALLPLYFLVHIRVGTGQWMLISVVGDHVFVTDSLGAPPHSCPAPWFQGSGRWSGVLSLPRFLHYWQVLDARVGGVSSYA